MSQYAALFERLRNYAAGVGPEAIEVISLIEAERDNLREALSSLLVSTKFELSGSTKRHRTSSDVVAWANLIAKSEAALHPTDNDHGDGT